MTDIRTKALALAALENEVLIWWDEMHDRYVAALDNRKVAVSDEIDIGLVDLYAKAAEALGLEPDHTLMALLTALEELVYLKDVLKHTEPSEYERRKPLAWEAARKAIAKAKGGEQQ